MITLKQIEQEHGVSRSALHTYRRSASFPQPVPVEGSTKIQYRADEVAAWFEANPPQQGKRTDLARHNEGVPVEATRLAVPPNEALEAAREFVQWLRAQFTEDERIARAADDSLGKVNMDWEYRPDDELGGKVVSARGYDLIYDVPAGIGAHVAEYDPRRALRELEAKRGILDLYATAVEDRVALRARMREALHTDPDEFGRLHRQESELMRVAEQLDPVVRLLGLPYVDRPGYREEWRP
ncbi:MULTISPECIES: DUF6221 family protein [Streptomyces]|uniref:DUF6221 family protein n=1 Tax=Streptomyces TaxID=1883 RepID=UPI00167B208F|nr:MULTISPECIES: DUF6221 family protein [Streptomyces]MBK3524840.1 hypothetical protein [Streptomyces sp. MBT70]